jgi:hypothetical protein
MQAKQVCAFAALVQEHTGHVRERGCGLCCDGCNGGVLSLTATRTEGAVVASGVVELEEEEEEEEEVVVVVGWMGQWNSCLCCDSGCDCDDGVAERSLVDDGLGPERCDCESPGMVFLFDYDNYQPSRCRATAQNT